MPDHDTLGPDRDRLAERLDLGGKEPGAHLRRLVRRDPRGAEAREVFGAGRRATGLEPAREGDRGSRGVEMTRAERTSGAIDHRGEVDVHPGLIQRPPRRPAGGQRIGGAAERRGGHSGRERVEGARASALLIDEDECATRARLASAPVLDDHARDAPGRGQPGHDHERRLLPRRQRRKIGRLLVAPRDKSESDLKQRAETHAT